MRKEIRIDEIEKIEIDRHGVVDIYCTRGSDTDNVLIHESDINILISSLISARNGFKCIFNLEDTSIKYL